MNANENLTVVPYTVDTQKDFHGIFFSIHDCTKLVQDVKEKKVQEIDLINQNLIIKTDEFFVFPELPEEYIKYIKEKKNVILFYLDNEINFLLSLK